MLPGLGRTGYGPAPEVIFGGFAFVMATGIVSIATGLVGFEWASAALLDLNLFVYPALFIALLIATMRERGSIVRVLRDSSTGPRHLTIVAATCVLGNEIALTGGHRGAAVVVWFAAAIFWLCLVYGFFAVTTMRPAKPDLAQGIDGTWLLIVVATEALAILTSRAGAGIAPPEVTVLVSLCLFLLGGAFYVLLLLPIVHRWLFFPMSPEQLTPADWINMGAAAITTLAGTRLIETIAAVPGLAPVGSFVFAATLLFWSVATWWIPLLLVLVLWRHGPGRVPLGYRLDNWSIVFPLGMYTTATWRLSHIGGLAFLESVPEVFVWVALAVWCLTFLGMLRAIAGWRPQPFARR